MRAAFRSALLLLPALLAGLPGPPREDAHADRSRFAAADYTLPVAFDVAPVAPSGVAKTDAGTPSGAHRQTQLRDGGIAARAAQAARARARAAASAHSEFAAFRLAERSNRHFFGSTAPPPLL